MSTAILEKLPIKIFADGADLESIVDLCGKPFIKGLTTNPTLMRKVGVTDYEVFARSVLESVTDKPISFEVFSDEFPEMRRQALKIRDWQENVYVKIPITNTRGESSHQSHPGFGRRGCETQCHGHPDSRASGSGCWRPESRHPLDGLRFRGPGGRYRGRSAAVNEGIAEADFGITQGRAALGERAGC
jgi:hypothetical protein